MMTANPETQGLGLGWGVKCELLLGEVPQTAGIPVSDMSMQYLSNTMKINARTSTLNKTSHF